MLDYPALAALAHIVRTGSFERAAAALGVTQSAISQRIKTLEERSGAVVLHRGPPPQPTAHGRKLIAHYDRVMLLESALNQQAAQPVIRIAVNADSLATWAMPALAAAPGLIDIVIDDQDHAEEWLKRGEVMAAITAQAGPVPGCDSHALGVMRYVAGASPGFVARHFPDGPSANALADAPMVTFNSKDRLQLRWLHQVTGRRLSPPTHLIPSSQAFASAARLGMGWGMNPEALHEPAEAAGELVALFPDHPLDITLHWQVARITAAPLQVLTDAIRRQARRALRPIAT